MNAKTKEEWNALVDKAVAGDKEALGALLTGVQDAVFNLALRMLGTFHDAEDATQDILVKIITHLSSFKKECAFPTWVFRITANHLKNYKKHMFAHAPLSFEYYGDDIQNGNTHDLPDLTQDVEKPLLAEELKLSCTNVMLQCLDAESRLIFILGTMFHPDSAVAGEILDMTPEAYRKQLSRVRSKMADFLSAYCGEYGNGTCRCHKRLNYAIQNHRLHPQNLEYTSAQKLPLELLTQVKTAMEEIDGLSAQFDFLKAYQPPERTKQFLQEFLSSAPLDTVKNT